MFSLTQISGPGDTTYKLFFWGIGISLMFIKSLAKKPLRYEFFLFTIARGLALLTICKQSDYSSYCRKLVRTCLGYKPIYLWSFKRAVQSRLYKRAFIDLVDAKNICSVRYTLQKGKRSKIWVKYRWSRPSIPTGLLAFQYKIVSSVSVCQYATYKMLIFCLGHEWSWRTTAELDLLNNKHRCQGTYGGKYRIITTSPLSEYLITAEPTDRFHVTSPLSKIQN